MSRGSCFGSDIVILESLETIIATGGWKVTGRFSTTQVPLCAKLIKGLVDKAIGDIGELSVHLQNGILTASSFASKRCDVRMSTIYPRMV